MSQVTSFAPGSFCWAELVTTDQSAAKEFYTNLFGWTANDMPMGPDQFYTMLELNGKNVGALYGMDVTQKERALPTHWNQYIAVASADESAAKAESLGAKILMAPFDVMEAGRMAAIQDTAGAAIMIWQAGRHLGASVVDEPGAFCWYELTAKDTDAAKAFYKGLFGWEAGGGAGYTEWILGEKHIGGMMAPQPEWGEVPPMWSGYVMVTNCGETAEKCTSLGGTVLVAPQDIQGATGRFAYLQDAQGGVFGIYQTLRAQ